MILSNDGRDFPILALKITDHIDVEIVKSYLLQSLNEFRKDYKEGPVKESDYLNRLA